MTKLLVVNVGSASLKWASLDLGSEERLVYGEEPWGLSDRPADAARIVNVVAQANGVDAVAHRVVHGGGSFQAAVRIDAPVRETLERILPLGPAHAPAALAAIDAITEALPGVPQLAAFDTAFHSTIPPEASIYALPYEWTERWGLRRHGFHGLSVSYAVDRATALLGKLPARLVVMHLGSGSSITAVKGGASIDTTMGFSPMDGMVMATRAGAIDASLVLHLQTEHGLEPEVIRDALQHRSGLLGISGVSGDLRQVRRAAQTSARATLAYAHLLFSARRALGAMLASLGGLDALVITGGVGEHDALLRQDLLQPFAWAGVELDAHANLWAVPDADITGSKSRVSVLVIGAREDIAIARAVRPLLLAPLAPLA